MYKFSLTGIGYKILACIITVAMVALFCVLVVFHQQVPFVAILFSAFVVLFCFLAFILCFTHRIIINLKAGNIIIANVKRHKIRIDKIKDITVNANPSVDSKRYCFCEVILLDGSIIKVAGYSSILKNGDVQRTREIVSRINMLLK